MKVLEGPRDFNKVKKDLIAAGHKNERIVVMVASDFPVLNAMGQVGADMLQQVGMNVDLQVTDWGSVMQRRASRNAPDKGGWSVFFTSFAGVDQFTPAGHLGLRGNGANGWFGWPTEPKLEEMRAAWFSAPDTATQKKIGEQIQAEAFESVPYLPLGEYFQPTALYKGPQRPAERLPDVLGGDESGLDGYFWSFMERMIVPGPHVGTGFIFRRTGHLKGGLHPLLAGSPAVVDRGAGEVKDLPKSGLIKSRTIAQVNNIRRVGTALGQDRPDLRIVAKLWRQQGAKLVDERAQAVLAALRFQKAARLVAKSQVAGTRGARGQCMWPATFLREQVDHEAP